MHPRLQIVWGCRFAIIIILIIWDLQFFLLIAGELEYFSGCFGIENDLVYCLISSYDVSCGRGSYLVVVIFCRMSLWLFSLTR